MPPAPDQPEQMPDQASPAAGSGQDRGRQVELILRQVDELPTLSQIESRLFELGTREDVDIEDDAQQI